MEMGVEQCGNGGATGARGKAAATRTLKAAGLSREDVAHYSRNGHSPEVASAELGVPLKTIRVEYLRKEAEDLGIVNREVDRYMKKNPEFKALMEPKNPGFEALMEPKRVSPKRGWTTKERDAA